MKYTRKLQEGGFISYTPVPTSPPAMPTAPSGAVSASAQDAGSSVLLDNDLKKELLTKGGLSNDTNALIEQLLKIEQQSSNPFLQRSNRTNSLALIGKINELRQNKEMWKESYDISKASGGLGEVAVGNSGELYVKDQDGVLKAVTISDYKKNQSKLRALSVAELLEERNSNPLLTGQNNIFNVANNSIGIDKISEYAQKIVKALGTETTKSENVYDSSRLSSELKAISAEIQSKGRTPSAEELKGFAILDTLKDSPSRYNEVLSESSTQRNHALKAVKYIWSTLGTNAQNKLSAQAVINGVDPSEMLLDLVVIGTNESSSTKITPISESKAVSGSDGGEGLTGSRPMTPLQMLMSGTLNTGNQFSFNDPEVNAMFKGLMTGSAALTSVNGKPLGPTTLTGVLKEGWEQLVNTDKIYFGDKQISTYQMSDVIVDGMSDIARVYLPVKSDGSPDTDSLRSYQQLMLQYNDNKDNMSIGEIQKVFRESGFNVKVNADKTLDVSAVGSDVRPFMIAYGYTNEGSALAEDNLSTEKPAGLKKLTSEEKEGMKTFEDIAWTIGSGKNTSSLKPKQGFFGRLGGTDRYKGIIFMPLREGADAIAFAMQGDGPRKPAFSEADVMFRAQQSSNIPFVQTSSLDLQ